MVSANRPRLKMMKHPLDGRECYTVEVQLWLGSTPEHALAYYSGLITEQDIPPELLEPCPSTEK